jgi:hypothetical protein
LVWCETVGCDFPSGSSRSQPHTSPASATRLRRLALNVEHLDEAIGFYSKLFKTEPAKVREGYANFAIAEPPLKLVLIEDHGTPGSLNHLGVEVESTDDVAARAGTRDQSTREQSDGRTIRPGR